MNNSENENKEGLDENIIEIDSLFEIKGIISENIIKYRKAKGMTQLELAELLNYSDKAVSKWERGDAIPDVSVLINIANIFQITLNDLCYQTNPIIEEKQENVKKQKSVSPVNKKRTMLALVFCSLVWLGATTVFALIHILSEGALRGYLSFIYAIPLTCLVLMVLNYFWWDKRIMYLSGSVLCWTLATAFYVTFFKAVSDMWLIFVIVGVLQVTLILSFLMSLIKKEQKNK